jgi:hypothetical protein
MGFDGGLERVLSRAAFDAEPSPSCVLDADGVILAVNAAWDAFARANAGPESLQSAGIIGKRWLDAIAGTEPRRLAAEAFREALASAQRPDDDGKPIEQHHRLHCNAPMLARGIDARFVPLSLEDGRVRVLVTYTTVVEHPIVPAGTGSFERFRDPNGMVRQCSGCRRVVEPFTGLFRFVPSFLEDPPDRVSHTICAICMDLWYGSGAWLDCQDET